MFPDAITGDAFRDGFSLPDLHVTLGLFIVALAAARILWRRTTPLHSHPGPSTSATANGDWKLDWRSSS